MCLRSRTQHGGGRYRSPYLSLRGQRLYLKATALPRKPLSMSIRLITRFLNSLFLDYCNMFCNVDQSEHSKSLENRLDMFSALLQDDDAFLKEMFFIAKTYPCNIQRFFTAVNMKKVQMKNCDIFLLFAQT